MSYPSYEVHYLKVNDADAIILRYEKSMDEAYTVLIDAGNVTDAQTIKDYLQNEWETSTIDLAICTHPDSDHKGGFFDLLKDSQIVIKEFWINSPDDVISIDDYKSIYSKGYSNWRYIEHCRSCFSHPSDKSEKNLVDLAKEKCENVFGVYEGYFHPSIPLQVLGPTRAFYKPLAFEILKDQKRHTLVDNTSYDGSVFVSESVTASKINNAPDDNSPTNAGSIIILFSPTPDTNFLFLGDANRAAVEDVLTHYSIEHAIVKVPHHGSINNLNTQIMDRVKPSCAMITAKGSKTHPSSEIVDYLSKYCNVYSTHQCKGTSLIFSPNKPKNPATPLKNKKSIKLIPRKK